MCFINLLGCFAKKLLLGASLVSSYMVLQKASVSKDPFRDADMEAPRVLHEAHLWVP